ncbi:alkaline phosphatase PhoX [Dactylosporangium sp. McL0621]|uniref:alkaline phosphatase PhoX n=1 Tax=Dactylosporangium sp. McL0621 TaxID=3415678 RepID=UPI003CF83C86
MTLRKRWIASGAAVAITAASIGALSGGTADAKDRLDWSSIPANADARGVAAPNGLSPQLREYIAAQGSNAVENPTALVKYFGYLNDGTLMPDPANGYAEASKTEPDKNTYLRLSNQHGADPHYNYGRNFVFQGHEGGKAGYITRVNLDADPAHRVTLLATTLADGSPIPAIDGSTWDPWARRLLFTVENGNKGAVLQATADVNSTVEDISSVLGRAGYEGIQNDSAGNVWLVEDSGGASPSGSKAKNPNSFIYRFVPNDRNNLKKGGRLEALQVISNRSHAPIAFQAIDAAHPTGGIFTDDQKDLSSYGNTFQTNWVTVHDTATDPSGQPFDANTLAKAAQATPFKRPENGVFRPGTDFREFFFTATGDTNVTSAANAGFGGWGGLFRLNQSDPRSDHGQLQLFFAGEQTHTGLDNIAFVDRDHVASVEDAGSTLHTQRNALDSAYLFDVKADYSRSGSEPVRFLAEGRDEAATLDALLIGSPGFTNEDDNEITGIHVSNGDPGTDGLLGARDPKPFKDGWRIFWTQQHGQNVLWEITDNGND